MSVAFRAVRTTLMSRHRHPGRLLGDLLVDCAIGTVRIGSQRMPYRLATHRGYVLKRQDAHLPRPCPNVSMLAGAHSTLLPDPGVTVQHDDAAMHE